MQPLARIDCFGLSDRGKERSRNEDQFLIADLARAILVQQTTLSVNKQKVMLGNGENKLFVVADGAGGHRNGHRASELAVHTITHFTLNYSNGKVNHP